jgi:hypothetical protein
LISGGPRAPGSARAGRGLPKAGGRAQPPARGAAQRRRLEELTANPLDKLSWKPPKVSETVDRRVVVNARQARELLTAVTYVGWQRRGPHARGQRLMALYACMYFAAERRSMATTSARRCWSSPGVHEFPDGLEAASASLAAGHGGVPHGDGSPQSAIAVRQRCSG